MFNWTEEYTTSRPRTAAELGRIWQFAATQTHNMWLAASPLGDLLWQGEREVMWDTVQLSATHTLQLSRQPDEGNAERQPPRRHRRHRRRQPRSARREAQYSALLEV